MRLVRVGPKIRSGAPSNRTAENIEVIRHVINENPQTSIASLSWTSISSTWEHLYHTGEKYSARESKDPSPPGGSSRFIKNVVPGFSFLGCLC